MNPAAPLPARREPLVPSNVLGMMIFVITEMMLFAGMISAYMIAEGVTAGGWPPPDQPRLPVEETALNSGALLLSGVVLFFAGRSFRRNIMLAKRLWIAAMLLGAFFVVFQGAEWAALIGQGLTLTFSTHGSFFFLIVGVHAIHAVAAMLALLWAYRRMLRGELETSQVWTVQIFWFFVVGVWPVLYNLVYL